MKKHKHPPKKNKPKWLVFLMLFIAVSAANAQNKAVQQTQLPNIKTLSQKICNPNVLKLRATKVIELGAFLDKTVVDRNNNDFANNISSSKKLTQIKFKPNTTGQLLHYSITDIL